VSKVVKEVGSGVNDNRAKFLALLEDQRVSTIVVEHKDRAIRFGFRYLETLLRSQGRRLEVVNLAEDNREDLLADLVSIVTHFFGRRNNKSLTRISFYTSDQQMLKIVQNLFESTRTVVFYSHPGIQPFDKRCEKAFTSKKQMYVFYVDSKQAVERFCQLGVTPNKSYAGPYPTVPQDVWWHFFRGILDGDGNINFSRKTGLKITIAGNRNCMLGLQSDLTELFFIRSIARYIDEVRVKLLELRVRCPSAGL